MTDGWRRLDRFASPCRLVLFAVALAVTGFAYRYLLELSFDECRSGWGAPYRLLVPFFSLFCLIRERRVIRESIDEPSVVGLFLLVPCLVCGWFGEQGVQLRFEIVGLLGTILTLVWAFFGFRTVRAVLYPVGMLVFCLYFDAWFMRGDRLSVAMGHATTEVIRCVAGMAGCFVIDRGPLLLIPGMGITVDTAALEFGSIAFVPCLVMISAYSYFALPTNLLRPLLVLCVVPFVVIGNVALAFAGGYGARYLVLAVCAVLAVPAGFLIRKGAERCGRR